MKYRGFQILKWTGPYNETPDKGEPHFFIQTHHRETGLPYRPDICPKAWSMREAIYKIQDMLYHETKYDGTPRK